MKKGVGLPAIRTSTGLGVEADFFKYLRVRAILAPVQ